MEERKKIQENLQQSQPGKFTPPTAPQITHILPHTPLGLRITPSNPSSLFQSSRLPITLIFLGSIETLVSLIFLFTFASPFFTAYKDLENVPFQLYLLSFFHFLVLGLPIAQIIVGTFLHIRQKNYVSLEKWAKTAGMILLFLSITGVGFMLFSILTTSVDFEKGKKNVKTQVNDIINPLATPTPIQ